MKSNFCNILRVFFSRDFALFLRCFDFFFFLRFVDVENRKEKITLRKPRRSKRQTTGGEGRRAGGGRGPAARRASLRRDSENLHVERRGWRPATTSSPRLDGRGGKASAVER